MEQASYSNAPELTDKEQRQAALRRYHILDTAPEKNFDRITSLVADVCDVPTALITLIDTERQWFKSCFGFDARQTDLGVSFCVHAVHQGELLVVEDATQDPAFKDNPLVTGPPHIRFYAGAPLTTPEGVHIGSLCIIDYEPRAFDAAQREILERLAKTVVSEFELRSAEAQFRQLYDENPQPMYVYEEGSGAILASNEQAQQQYGRDEADFLRCTVDDLRAPDDVQPQSGSVEMHQRKDGSHFPVEVRAKSILYDGKSAHLVVPRSVTERAQDDQTIFFQTDLDGATQALSPEWTDVTGFSVGETIGAPLVDFVHPLDRSATKEAFTALLDGETDACEHEARFSTETGHQSFELHARLLTDNDDAPTGVAGTLVPVIDYDAPDDASPPEDATAETGAPSGDGVSGDVPVRNESPEADASQDAPEEDPSQDEVQVRDLADEGAPSPDSFADAEDSTDAAEEPAAEEPSEQEPAEPESSEQEPAAAPSPDAPSAGESPARDEPSGPESDADGQDGGSIFGESSFGEPSGSGGADDEPSFPPSPSASSPAASDPETPSTADADATDAATAEAAADEASDEATAGEASGEATAGEAPSPETTPEGAGASTGSPAQTDAGDAMPTATDPDVSGAGVSGSVDPGPGALEDVLDAISAGADVELSPESFGVAKSIQAAVQRCERRAEEKGLTIRTGLPEPTAQARLDPRLFHVILETLITNAIRYTDEGEVVVRGSVREDEVVVEVEDPGPAIGQRFLDGYVSDDDLEASDDLEVIHRLTHLMQGSVDMESETESGTVFTITLPREFDADSAASSGDASSDDTFPLA